MKLGFTILLFAIAVLALLSGIAKIMLMQNEVEFFGQYGFSAPMLVAFGATQVLGGVMLPWMKTRFAGATIIACTFIVSLAILIIDGNITVGLVTAIVTVPLLVIIKTNWPSRAKDLTNQ